MLVRVGLEEDLMKFRLSLIGLGTSALTILAACGNGPPPDTGASASGGGGGGGAVTLVDKGPGAAKVGETDALKFSPEAATIKAGEVVEFDNTGQTAHNVTFDSGAATQGNMGGGDTVFFKFASAGTYKFQCTLHSGMTGQIVVQ